MALARASLLCPMPTELAGQRVRGLSAASKRRARSARKERPEPGAASQAADRPIGLDLSVLVGLASALIDDPIAPRTELVGEPAVRCVRPPRDLRPLDTEGAIVEAAAEGLGTSRQSGRGQDEKRGKDKTGHSGSSQIPVLSRRR